MEAIDANLRHVDFVIPGEFAARSADCVGLLHLVAVSQGLSLCYLSFLCYPHNDARRAGDQPRDTVRATNQARPASIPPGADKGYLRKTFDGIRTSHQTARQTLRRPLIQLDDNRSPLASTYIFASIAPPSDGRG